MGEKKDGDKKQNEGQSKADGGATTVVFKFDMHCEGCAKKVRRSIKNFDGVENVKTDCANGKLTVVGNVDAVKIQEKVEEKTKKKVELVSLQPYKPSNKEGGGGEKKSDEKKSEAKPKSGDNKKSEDKKEKEKPKKSPVATVVLRTRVHCEGCAQKIKKIVGKYDGVEEVNVDLQKDLITVKGTMNMKDLLPYLNVKLKRVVEIAPPKKDEGKPKEGGGDSKEKPKEGGQKPKEGDQKPKEGGEKPKAGGGGASEKPKEEKKEEKKDKKDAAEGSSSAPKENVTMNKMEYNPYSYGYGAYAYTYDPRQQVDNYGYGQQQQHQVIEYWNAPEYSLAPQMFSDENPNACSLM
ncbi:heavy metal-associated isoprenylated plant protein 3 [Amaranthus tricolor]|uniref:heavy metal-associated isoprenylated plant protein 3 n=1 Tax=Amaranthus tricolor TaxID=29722 RepID=UPI002588B6A2|nr:heavy metal-associated isoprenylated plant protein 3 [Amaranthus tricolor]